MRCLLAIVSLFLLCMMPCVAHAQQRGDGGPADDIVDLQEIRSVAPTGSRRSAFGRVMDVMIARLIEQEAMPERAPQGARPVAVAPAMAPRAAKADDSPPRIDIAIGERFALPPAESLSRASVPEQAGKRSRR